MEGSTLQLPTQVKSAPTAVGLRRKNIYAGECIFAPLGPLLLPVQALLFIP